MNIDALLECMNGKQILVIGDIMADAYIKGKVDRISPEAPVPVLQTRSKEIRLGGAANVALNLKALGVKVRLAAAVGTDDMGDAVIQLLHKESIPTDGIVRLPNRPTTVKTRIMAGSQHLLRLDEEINLPTFEEEKSLILPSILGAISHIDAIIFEDYDKGFIFPEMIREVVKEAKKLNIPVLVDPKKRHFSDFMEVTLFKPNLKELKDGLHVDVIPSDSASIQKACSEVARHLDCHSVLLTLSEFGMAYWSKEYFFHTPAKKRTIADVSGAGDTVIAVAAACLACQAPPDLTLQMANLAGGLVCEHAGVVPIDKAVLTKEAASLI